MSLEDYGFQARNPMYEGHSGAGPDQSYDPYAEDPMQGALMNTQPTIGELVGPSRGGGAPVSMAEADSTMKSVGGEPLSGADGGGMNFQGIAAMAGALGGLGGQIASLFKKKEQPRRSSYRPTSSSNPFG